MFQVIINIEVPIRQSERRFVSGESHYYKGNRYLLKVIYHNAAPKVEIRNKTYIDLYVRVGSTLEQREKVLIEWYRRQLKDQIPPLIDVLELRMLIGVYLSMPFSRWQKDELPHHLF
jgi:hypothetical protein